MYFDESIHQSGLRVIEQIAGELVVVEGDLNQASTPELTRLMRRLTAYSDSPLTIDLSALDIDDGIAVATFINAMRDLLSRSARLIIRGAPQILGHNLYRVGMLGEGSRVELVDMRLDEAS